MPNRNQTHCDRVLDRLRKGPATSRELYRLGVMTHSRVADLRRRGHVIECAISFQRGRRVYTYTLVSDDRVAA